jgi:hypothetical protein
MKKGKGLVLSDSRVLIGLSVLLLLIGGTVMDPLAGFSFLVLAGLLAAFAAVRGKRWLRYVAIALLIAAGALAGSISSKAFHHLGTYMKGSGDVRGR